MNVLLSGFKIASHEFSTPSFYTTRNKVVKNLYIEAVSIDIDINWQKAKECSSLFGAIIVIIN